MARYLGPRCKISRREHADLDLIAYRPINTKCKIDIPPGIHGSKGVRLSDYGRQLRAKQKIRRVYGVLEAQFRRYYQNAVRLQGATGENLMQILESRLDNVVYRLSFAVTRAEARQMVSHRQILVNGQIVNIPSYQVKPGDMIEVREKARQQLRVKAAASHGQEKGFVDWVEVDSNNAKGKLLRVPVLSELTQELMFNTVVELYSK